MADIRLHKFKPSKINVEVLLLADLVTQKSTYLTKPHRTDFYHIFLVGNCSPNHVVDFNTISIEPYSILFIDKGRVHQFDPLLKYEGYGLIFTDDFFCTTEAHIKFLRSSILFRDLMDLPSIKVGHEKYLQFKSRLNELKQEIESTELYGKGTITQNLLHNFLLFSEKEKLKNTLVKPTVKAHTDDTLLFMDLLEKFFTESKRVAFYAAKLSISEKRLGKATSKAIGKMPKEIINERLMLEAKRLLVHGNKSIKEIGFELGFDDPTHFIKFFRKHAQKTPVAFRGGFATF